MTKSVAAEMIAPKIRNMAGEAWLPVFCTNQVAMFTGEGGTTKS
jgi:hypothetical protein